MIAGPGRPRLPRRALLVGVGVAVLAACRPGSTGPGDAPPATCTDRAVNGGESDVDCGGPCRPCGTGMGCAVASDCDTGVCGAGVCVAVECADGVRDGYETDVDCGGACAPCGDGRACGFAWDCASGVCDGGSCAAPSCTDAVRNGDETGVDCGGACPRCGTAAECTSGAECASGVCLDHSCDCGDGSGVYVSAGSGDDANPGTAAAPLRTIQAAVACAHQLGREIRVAEGVYEGSGSSPVMLEEGKSLVGGWAPDFASRSPHSSEIRDTTDTGTDATGTGTGTGVAVRVSSSSAATVLEGFTIQATRTGAGLRAIAIAVSPASGQGAGATIRDNVIDCGGNPVIWRARCVDLGNSGGTFVVANNVIVLGTSDPVDGKSSGIQSDGVSVAVIEGNVLEGGSSASIVPIDLWVAPAAAPVVAANDVRPGPGAEVGIRVQLLSDAATPAIRNNVVVVSGAAVGIDDAAAAEISNNTVVVATGTGIRTGVAGAILRNNSVLAEPGGTCIAEANATAAPAAVRNDDLYGCAALYVDGATGLPLSLDDLNARAGAASNLSADPTLDPANGYRPLPGSPLLGAGVDLSPLFQTDKAGAVRTAPWSIGAYQGP